MVDDADSLKSPDLSQMDPKKLLNDGDRAIENTAKAIGFKNIIIYVIVATSITILGSTIPRLILKAVTTDPTVQAGNVLNGYVRDPGGKPVSGCKLELVGMSADGVEIMRKATSDSNGYFIFNSLDLFSSNTSLRLQASRDGYEIREHNLDRSRPHYYIDQVLFPREKVPSK